MTFCHMHYIVKTASESALAPCIALISLQCQTTLSIDHLMRDSKQAEENGSELKSAKIICGLDSLGFPPSPPVYFAIWVVWVMLGLGHLGHWVLKQIIFHYCWSLL